MEEGGGGKHLLIHAHSLDLAFVAEGGTKISSYGMQYNAKHPANARHRYNEVLETCLIKAQDVTFSKEELTERVQRVVLSHSHVHGVSPSVEKT